MLRTEQITTAHRDQRDWQRTERWTRLEGSGRRFSEHRVRLAADVAIFCSAVPVCDQNNPVLTDIILGDLLRLLISG